MKTHRSISFSIGDRIRQARKACDLTQKALSQKVRVSIVTLNRIENGRRPPSIEVLERLAEILECDLRWINTGDESYAGDSKTNGLTYEPNYDKESQVDQTLSEIIQILENDLPEAKEHVLKILIARKEMKEGLNALGMTGS